jgi:glycerate kinase
MTGSRAIACPSSLKSVLAARDAAAALVHGFSGAGVACDAMAVADGGEGTLDVLAETIEYVDSTDAFGRPRRTRIGRRGTTAVVEAAEVIPFDAARLDVRAASSRGLGNVLAGVRAERLVVTLGGTANMDAGAGLLEVLEELPAPTTVLCDVRTTLYDAPRLFGPQKGASPHDVAALEARFRRDERLAPFAGVAGGGAAGGLGAALASLGAELAPGAGAVLDLLGFDPGGYELVVTGEGRVDATTAEGKAPAEVARRCRGASVPCVVFGGIVVEPLAGAETVPLSGDPAAAAADLEALGRRLGSRLLDAAR